MRQYADKYHLIMIASGEKDIITDGTAIYICENGDPNGKDHRQRMYVFGYAGGFSGNRAFGAKRGSLLCFCRVAGELASEKTDACGGGTMTFRNFFIDEVSLMSTGKNEQMQGTHMITLNDYHIMYTKKCLN